MHNISTARAINNIDSRHYAGDHRVPVTGKDSGEFCNPVLTVVDKNGREARMLFHASNPFDKAALVLNPWAVDETVRIEGEDLFALVELLEEIKGDLVAPAPTFDNDHGTVLVEGSGDWWIFNGHTGHWGCIGTPGRAWFVEQAEECLAPSFGTSSFPGFDAGSSALFRIYGEPVEPVDERHGAGLVDADNDFWLFNAKVSRWYLIGSMNDAEQSWFMADVERVLERTDSQHAPGDPRCGFDEGAEGIFEQYGGAIVAPKPRWIDGDVVHATGSRDAIWTRHNGVWNLPHGMMGSRDISDEEVSTLVGDTTLRAPWVVLRQQNA